MTAGAVLAVAALVTGLGVAILDMLVDQIPLVLVLLAVLGFAFGMMGPRWSLLSGVLLGLGVPIAQAFVALFPLTLPHQMHGFFGGALAVAPPVAGAVVGMFVGDWLADVRQSRRRPEVERRGAARTSDEAPYSRSLPPKLDGTS